MALRFLVQSTKWAPVIGMIMHENKGNPTFAHQVWKACPRLRLIHREFIDKNDSTFAMGSGKRRKYVPCSIFIYRMEHAALPEPMKHRSIVCADFVFLDLDDDRCNMVVKSWGAKNRVGRMVTCERSAILEEVAKVRKTKGKHGVNMHLLCVNVGRSKLVIEAMESDVAEYLSYVRNASNAKITPAQFVYFYNKHAAANLYFLRFGMVTRNV